MPVGQAADQLRGQLARTAHDNEVVAEAMHFGKSQLHIFLVGWAGFCSA
jgi:hypothetical protein